MSARQMFKLARWLFGPLANRTNVREMVARWQAAPGCADRWAEVRAREAARAARGSR